jgi:2-dehydro-3-deoxygluconokinase
MPDLVTIGETMLRFTAADHQTLEQADYFRVDPGGAESNVAVALARLGFSTAWISRLPQNPLGRRVAGRIGAHGVDVSRVLWTAQGRIGLWYFEKPAPPRPGQAYYDRAHSAFSQIDPDEVDWAFVRSARWLHLTGITPALSPNCHALVQRALDEVKDTAITVSFDVNYRARLWTPDAARRVLEPLLHRVAVIFCPLRDAQLVFGEQGDATTIARAWHARFGARLVVITAGQAGAVAFDGVEHRINKWYPVNEVDPLGTGDAFVAGFIGGLWESGVDTGLEWGAAMAALKQSYLGDLVWCTRDDLLHLIAQGVTDVQR